MKKEGRKDFLKKELLKHLKSIPTEKDRKIYMDKVFNPNIVSGTFKDYLKGDLKESDKKFLKEILAEFKADKILFHIARDQWVFV